MKVFLYNFSVFLYTAGIRIASLWNDKAMLWVKGRKNFPVFNDNKKSIWMHCASLGEFEQGRPVLEALKKEFPDYKLVLSFFSPSGYEIRKNYSGADQIIYLPSDTAGNAIKLIDSINPSLVIWVKYEYWFHYLSELKKRNVPVLLISGIFRTSQPFFKWYGNFWKNILSCFSHLFVQNKQSFDLLNSIGVNKNISISGDTRFDRVIDLAKSNEPISGINEFINNNPSLIAGSTWEDDEAGLIHYVRIHNNIKFIVAPHEVNAANLNDLKKEFNNSIFYSDWILQNEWTTECNVLIIDNIGMLSKIYKYATVTYVGGGFNSTGIHNILEAAVYGKPIVFGPEYEKFAEANDLIESGSAFSINSAVELEKKLNLLFNDVELLKQAGEISRNYVYEKCGATKKVIDYVTENRLLTN